MPGRKTEAEKQKCRDDYKACQESCNNEEMQALEDDIARRKACLNQYFADMQECNASNNTPAYDACMKKAKEKYFKCLKACDAPYQAALAKVKEHRKKCDDDFVNCLSK